MFEKGAMATASRVRKLLRGASACLALTVMNYPSPTPTWAQQQLPQGITQSGVMMAIQAAAASDCPKARETAAHMRQMILAGDFFHAAWDMPALNAFVEVCNREKAECGKGPARIGMTKEQAVRTSWCSPDAINRTTTAGHVKEQWVYQSRDHPRINRGYLYFDNGRLTAIQETR